ncbi:MAG: hypothetical protein ACI4NG_00900 [Candidatus Gallimonas sp.]
MKKLFRIIGATLALSSVCALAACGDQVDLDSGATVALNVTTEAAELEVVSTYGTVSGGGNRYTVSVAKKKSFVISVSADGYRTLNVPVTVADLKTGSCEKNVELKDAIGKGIEITVSGQTENAAVACGEKTFVRKSGKFVAELSEEELRQGISVTADGAEPYSLTLTEEELSASYYSTDVYLVQTGYKLVEIRGNAGSYYALDEQGDFLAMSATSSGGRISVEADFSGTIFLCQNTQVVQTVFVTPQTPVYGTSVFVGEQDNQALRASVYGAPEDSDSDYIYYAESETAVSRIWSNLSYGGGGKEQVLYLDSIPKDAAWIWRIKQGVAERAAFQANVNWSDFSPRTPEVQILIWDEIVGAPTENVTAVSCNGTTLSALGEGKYSLGLNGLGDSVGVSLADEGERWLSADDYAVKEGETWVFRVRCNRRVRYRLRVTGVTGGSVVWKGATGSQSCLLENGVCEVYSNSAMGVVSLSVFADGKIMQTAVDFSLTDAEKSAKVCERTVEFSSTDRFGFVLYVQSPYGGVKATTSDADATVSRIDYGYAFYVQARYEDGGSVTLTVTYRTSYDSVQEESKQVTVSFEDAMNGSYNLYL